MAKRKVDNYTGCIVGGAIGDALGAPVEFKLLPVILSTYGPSGVNDYVEFENGKGEITDDTQMLLFTAEGLLRSLNRAASKGIWGGYTTICYQSYQRWLYTQSDWRSNNTHATVNLEGWLVKEEFLYTRRAPGETCLTALLKGVAGTMEAPINNSKGCGGIMRIAPVGLLFHKDPKQAFQIGAELAAMTHGHPSGYLSAGYLAALLSSINNGSSLQHAIHSSTLILQKYKQHNEVLHAVEKAVTLHQMQTPSYANVELLGGGWVGEEALSISLYCALSYETDFEKAINLAINHGGDTDSTGAITGNIVGLLLGEKAIPQRWISNLLNCEKIKQIGIDLYTEVRGNEYEPDREWNEKYPIF